MFDLIDRPLTAKEHRESTIETMGEAWVLDFEKNELGMRIDELPWLPKEIPEKYKTSQND